MKLLTTTVAVLISAMLCSCSHKPKNCEELKSEIANRMDANGAKSYWLEIVSKDKKTDGKVVGTCDAGTNKIVYHKTSTPQH